MNAGASSADRDWFVISALMTGALGLAALLLMMTLPFTALPDPIASLTSWFAWTFFACGFSIIFYTLSLMRSREARPIRTLADNWRTGRRRYLTIVGGMILAGLDMYFYMIMKPELNLLFPFWADPYLADLDKWILGQDGWRYFASWNLEFMSWVYSPFWFFSILLTFYWLLVKPPSARKSAAIIAYFATWSVFGTLGQAFLSSGGPIFYSRLGFGSRFDPLLVPELEQRIAGYLWHMHTHDSLAPGAGISAMPSLHIATMAWMVITFAAFRSRLIVPAALLSLYIFAGSIALGWHYMTDGLVGAAGAGLCFYFARLYFARREQVRLVLQQV